MKDNRWNRTRYYTSWIITGLYCLSSEYNTGPEMKGTSKVLETVKIIQNCCCVFWKLIKDVWILLNKSEQNWISCLEKDQQRHLWSVFIISVDIRIVAPEIHLDIWIRAPRNTQTCSSSIAVFTPRAPLSHATPAYKCFSHSQLLWQKMIDEIRFCQECKVRWTTGCKSLVVYIGIVTCSHCCWDCNWI